MKGVRYSMGTSRVVCERPLILTQGRMWEWWEKRESFKWISEAFRKIRVIQPNVLRPGLRLVAGSKYRKG